MTELIEAADDSYRVNVDRPLRDFLAVHVVALGRLLGVDLVAAGDPVEEDPGAAERGFRSPTAPGWPAEAVEAPTDPVLARLFPAASEDAGIAAEFRRLTSSDLHEGKVAGLRLVWAGLRRPAEAIVIERATAPRWAAALTDIRLYLGGRLGIETEADGERVRMLAEEGSAAFAEGREELFEPGTARPRPWAVAVAYSVFSLLQDSLVEAMLAELPTAGEGRG